MPVLMPSAASTLTVNAVPKRAVFSSVCGYRPSASHFSAVSGRQIRPRPNFAMKLIISGVTFSAAQTKIPLVLPVFRIHQNDHLALPEVLKHLRNFTELLYRVSSPAQLVSLS